MFDILIKKIQKMEKDILFLCEMKIIDLRAYETLYDLLNGLEDLKGYINEIENTILEEDSWMDNTNLES